MMSVNGSGSETEANKKPLFQFPHSRCLYPYKNRTSRAWIQSKIELHRNDAESGYFALCPAIDCRSKNSNSWKWVSFLISYCNSNKYFFALNLKKIPTSWTTIDFTAYHPWTWCRRGSSPISVFRAKEDNIEALLWLRHCVRRVCHHGCPLFKRVSTSIATDDIPYMTQTPLLTLNFSEDVNNITILVGTNHCQKVDHAWTL